MALGKAASWRLAVLPAVTHGILVVLTPSPDLLEKYIWILAVSFFL